MKAESRDKSIEFIKKESPPRHPNTTTWQETHVYVCSRQGSGGHSAYRPKHNWDRKIDSKRTGCPCRLTVKTYPDTSEVLGYYKEDHSHVIGDENLKFTRLDVETREEIAKYLRMGVEPKKVLEQITRNMYREENLDDLRSKKKNRRHLVTRADIRRIQKMIEEETIRLASGDGASVLEWVSKLKEAGHFVFLKRRMPAAWMISSNSKETTVDYFLATILLQNPTISPFVFMSDYNWPQLHSIRRRYPKSKLLLCWWHVLHAWQQHFVTQHHPLLWEKLQAWIRITDQDEFDACWAEIRSLAPPSVVTYLEEHWMKVVELWSAVFRLDRTIFDLGDTNMLVEAWHHLLKGDFLEGKWNRRLDHLIHTLCDIAIPHFIARHHRQSLGFEGPDLALKHRKAVIKRASTIPREAIQLDPETRKYIIRSLSDPDIFYEVDLDAYDCTCLSFPLIRFCKHVCAVQHHFPEAEAKIPVTALIVPAPDEFEDSDFDEPQARSVPELTQAQKDRENIDHLAHRLESLVLSCLNPPSVMTEQLRQSVLDATEVLDILDSHLTPVVILPRQKARIAPNQHSWPETREVMNAPVKSKRRAENGPYGGNEKSGKKAKTDATGELSFMPPSTPTEPTIAIPDTATNSQASYYRPRPNIPVSTQPSTSTLHSLSTKSSAALVAFDVDSFDLSDNKALELLNNRQLRAVCLKHDIDTARSNDDMVRNIQAHYRKGQRQPMPSYSFYPNMYYPAMYYPPPNA
ncbi:hypothetical protein C8R43DRAFT_885158 [Mycena crocata]|nr:hypothetical protein C8R43DRAFT_885158 [Mycena crocata]